ncbi:hypothetical protein C3K47_19180 [Solitalea longa]|uniref:Uncharacterized protein n=1 Tax=Solitalea longa TaxID=2079460 RepID=A0A2S4ZXQ8_9SPHI|nr:hypothetical protein [Solitalea longa]POY34673.1 hypothetical protein C3K47_19180 [Solitalea longa]
MTRLIILTLILFGQFAYGQTQDSISKIIFHYSKGHSSWNKPGIYGRSEQIEITCGVDRIYKLTSYFRVNYSAGTDGKTFTKDTVSMSSSKIVYIDQLQIHNWLVQINTPKENFTVSFVQPHLSKITEKEISVVAKVMQKDAFFDKDFKEERKDAIRKVQNFFNLDSFLVETRANTENQMIVTDSWDKLRIEVIKNKDTTTYDSQFFVPLGQPLQRFNHKDFTTESIVYNLEANISAQEFLPKGSLIYKVFDFNSIKEHYIYWYLDKFF